MKRIGLFQWLIDNFDSLEFLCQEKDNFDIFKFRTYIVIYMGKEYMKFSYMKKFVEDPRYLCVHIERINEYVSQVGGLQAGATLTQSTTMANKSSTNTTSDPTQNIVEADPAQGADTHQIATFLDDAAIQEATLPGLTSPEAPALAPASESRHHTIEDILARPMLVSSASWTTGLSQNADLNLGSTTTLSFPSALIDNIDIIADKIKNFTYLRADICIRVTVNASTFQLGKLLAYFAPFSQVVGNRATLNEHLSAKTTFPHVVLDAATGNSGVLRIPYVSPYTHYNLVTQQGDMGNLKISVLNQLSGGTDVTVSVFAWFENIDLGLPTDAGRFSTFVSTPETIPPDEQLVLAKLINSGYIRVSRKVKEDAMKMVKLKEFESQMAEDTDKSKTGIVTDTLEHISAATRNMEGLPFIGDIFKPVAWLSNAASKVSGTLGFCKPTSTSTQSKFQQQPGFGYTHATGLDQSTTLGTQPDNQLVPKSGMFGSDVDEMDINFLTSRSNWFHTQNWSVDDSASNILYSLPVAPGVSNVNGSNTIDPTMLGFVCAPFRYWTGGLTYVVQVAKTSYHSGRMRISFVPSGTAGQNYDANNCYTWILDLRTSNQIEFTIPYTANTQFKNLSLFPKATAPDVSFTTGVLQFEVLNVLRAPETVPQVVQFNLWIAGAPDFKLAVPDFTQYAVVDPTPIPPSIRPPQPRGRTEYVGILPDTEENKYIGPNLRRSPRSVPHLDYDVDSDFESQVLGNFQDPGFNDFTPAAKMFEMNTSSPLEKSALTIGEDITSIRQLIKRFGYKKINSSSTDKFYVSGSTAYFGDALSLTEAQDPTTYGTVPVEYFSWIYRFFRGGRRYKLLSRPAPRSYLGSSTFSIPLATEMDVYAGHRVGATNVPVAITSGASSISNEFIRFCLSSNFSNYTFSATNEVNEITCPYYSNCHILPIMGTDGDILSDIRYNNFLFETRARDSALTPLETTAVSNPELLISGGDDLDFGWVVGQPSITSLAII